MSIYSKVTKQNSIKSSKLAEQQKIQRALKFKNRFLKQTQVGKLAENLSPITNKLENINESTEKIGEVIKESNSENENNQETVPIAIDSDYSEDDNKPNTKALPKSSKFIKSMRQMIGSLMNSQNCLNITQDESGRAIFLSVPFQKLGAHRIQLNENIFDFTSEIYEALSSTSYSGETMKVDSGFLMMNFIIRFLGYTGDGDESSKRETLFTTKNILN